MQDLILSNELLIQLLLFITILFITFEVTDKFFNNKKLATITGIIVALLSVRYISYSDLNLLLQSYGFLGLITLMFVPFLIAFYFIYTIDISGVLRKIFWIFYGMINIAILSNKSNYLTDETTIIILTSTIFLIILDKSIKNWFNIRKNLKQ